MKHFTLSCRIMCATVMLLLTDHAVRAQSIILVNAASSNPTPGTTSSPSAAGWAQGCNDLQAAMDASARAGGAYVVWVKMGTYKPSAYPFGCSSCSSNRDKAFSLNNGVAVYGGFNGTETALSQRNATANPTILSGDIGIAGNNSDNCYHVVVSINKNNSSALDGFTIRDGNANGDGANTIYSNCGGGMFNRSSSPTIANCVFTANSCKFQGGGIYNDVSSAPVLNNCTFSSNSGYTGGGMYNFLSTSPVLNGCSFSSNSSSSGGGGMYNDNNCMPVLNNCTFSSNTSGFGGGIVNMASSPTLTNCTFSANAGSQSGGGMYNGSSNAALTNCTFSSNSSSSGGGMYNSNSPTKLNNCRFLSNSSNGYGGGMVNGSSNATLTNCTFSSNTAISGGGVANLSSSSPVFNNCIFLSNSGNYAGGASYNGQSSQPSFINCTILSNNSQWGGAMDNDYGNAVVTNTVIWANTGMQPGIFDNGGSATVTYSLVQESVYTGTGNLSADPLYVNAADPDGADNIFGTADDGLKLRFGSPAINAGNNAAVSAGVTTDITGAARIQNGLADMGAYEGFACPAYTTLYVDNSRATAGDGSSWATAFKELRDALSVAKQCSNLSAILVAKGTYKPAGDMNRNNAFAILRGGLKIYGGYPTGGGTRNVTANPTILSGDIGTVNTNTDNSYHVLVIAGLTGAADSVVVDGFTITGGNANGTGEATNYNGPRVFNNEGGGVYLHSNNGAAGKIALRNCRVNGNNATLYGGGLYNQLSSPSLSNCAFTANTANNGGAIFNYNASSPKITNSIFVGNTATMNGGGILNWTGSSPVLTHCSFSYNNSSYGGAISNDASSPVLGNCILWGNTGPYPAIFNSNSANPAVTYSLVQGGYAGTANINADPFFTNAADPDGADNVFGTTDDGLKLQTGSPAANAGSNALVPAGITTDITGTARILDGTADIGAYEGGSCPAYHKLYVNGSAAGGNGSSWQTAIRELRDALLVAAQCGSVDSIVVAAGTYKPTNNTSRDSAFTFLKGGLKVIGGYNAATGIRDPAANPSILSGDIGGVGDVYDNSYHVLVVAGLSNAADSLVIDGFTITGGRAEAEGGRLYNGAMVMRNEGAGIYLHSNNGAGSKIAVRNCIIKSNMAALYGGGFYNQLSSPAIINCIFSFNTTGSVNSYINGGAGLFNYNASAPAVVNCIFTYNSGSYGGGIYNWSSSPTFTNCTASANAGNYGSTMYNTSSSPVITNCIIYRDLMVTGVAVYNDNSTPVITYSMVQGVYTGTGNLDSNQYPWFVNTNDPDGPDNIFGTADDGLRVRTGSPTINAGSNTVVPSGTGTDVSGVARIQNGTVDMGAYELTYTGNGSSVAAAGSQATNVKEGVAAKLTGEQAAAKKLSVTVLNNPLVGSEVECIVRGVQGERLRVTLLDMQGRIIAERQVPQAGLAETQRLSTGNSAAGMLFLRVSTQKETITIKVMKGR